MNKQEAIKEIGCRIGDFWAWSGVAMPPDVGRKEAGQPLMLLDNGELVRLWKLSSVQEKHVAYLQKAFPIVRNNDPGAWSQNGRKRVELDEALVALGYESLQD